MQVQPTMLTYMIDGTIIGLPKGTQVECNARIKQVQNTFENGEAVPLPIKVYNYVTKRIDYIHHSQRIKTW